MRSLLKTVLRAQSFWFGLGLGVGAYLGQQAGQQLAAEAHKRYVAGCLLNIGDDITTTAECEAKWRKLPQ